MHIVVTNNSMNKKFLINEEDEYIFGRDESCEFQILNDNLISKVHFNIKFVNNIVTLKDLNSINGTFINDKKVNRNSIILKNEDIIKVGKTLLQVFIKDVEPNNNELFEVARTNVNTKIIIDIKSLSKHYKILNRREGLIGTAKDLFSRDYRIVKSVDNVSFQVTKGEVVGFLGPNGAGKSTTIKMMTGVLEPTNGEIVVNGKIPYRNRTENAQQIGVVFGQRSQLWWALPVIESFKIIKEIYRIDKKLYEENLRLFDQLVNISELYLKPVRQMSLGQRTLCDIVAAFLHNPKVVFLDEPTIGLDVLMKSKIRELIKEINIHKNTTIILTSHDMGDIEELCNRIIIMDKGKIIFNDSFSRMKNIHGKHRTLKIKIDSKQAKLGNVIEILGRYIHEEIIILSDGIEGWINVEIDESRELLTNILHLITNSIAVLDLKIEETEAEDVVKRIYKGGERS